MYLIQTFSENNNKRGNTLQLFFYKVNGFPGGSEVKGSASYTEDLGSIPGSGRSPGEGNGNPLQYSCLENPTDRGAWRTTVHGVAKSHTQLKQLSTQKETREMIL